MSILVTQTNLFAELSQAKNGVDQNWIPVTLEEMRAWLGMRVAMSVVHLPSIELYWSEDFLFGGHRIANIMTRARYSKISQYLHIADERRHVPRGQPGHDKLYKVREVLEIVRKMCLQNYNAHQNTSIDEGMVAFRGRLSFRQYLPSKPTKYGIKIWMRADPNNGYVNDFQVYTGKEGNSQEGGLGTRVVMDLTQPIKDRCHIVNCDNFFMSPQLCEELDKVGTYARGTVRANRKGFPRATLQAKNLKQQGDMTVAQRGDTLAVSWKDKKVVNLMSTADDPATLQDTVNRKRKDGSICQVPCPSVVKQYNNNMNGVDRADQLRAELSTYRTSKKWWLYLFWYLFDVCVCNAFVVMRDSPHHQMKTKKDTVKARTQVQFRMALAKQLIGTFQGMRKRKRLANEDQAGVSHFPASAPKRKRFRECSKSGVRKDSRYMCKACDVGLCVDCFEPYHVALSKGR